MTVILFTMLVFLPSWAAFGLWPAQGLTLGLLGGYLAYSVLHHGMHHWPVRGAWLRQRRRWHALHHGSGQAACYGVSTGLWDRLCGTAPPARVGDAGRLAGVRADRGADRRAG